MTVALVCLFKILAERMRTGPGAGRVTVCTAL